MTDGPRGPGRRIWRAAFAVVTVLSLLVLFLPSSDVPNGVQMSDKLVHFLLFTLLAATGLLAGVPPVGLAVALVAYAGASEVLQSVLPIDRQGEVRDALADTLGVLAGLAVVTLTKRRDRRVDS